MQCSQCGGYVPPFAWYGLTLPKICTCAATAAKGAGLTGTGWECPRCRRVNAPWMSACACHPATVTTTKTTTDVTDTTITITGGKADAQSVADEVMRRINTGMRSRR